MNLNSWCARTQQPAGCNIITGRNSHWRNFYVSLGLMKFYRTGEQLWWNHVCVRRSKWVPGTAKRRWGGEETLSSTFHKIRPLEIRWCHNLCICCYMLKRSFMVQARKILALASLHANWNHCVSAQHSKMECCGDNGNTMALVVSKYTFQDYQPWEKGGYYCRTRGCVE